MSLFSPQKLKVITQGITGRMGTYHTERCLSYGTHIVGGVTPGKGGTQVCGLPVYDSVYQAVQNTGANASQVFVPAPAAKSAVLEAADAGIRLIVLITEGVPIQDMLTIRKALYGRNITLIGPNTPGLLWPGKAKMGIMPGDAFAPGSIGIVSRSGTLVYEAAAQLTDAGLGQSTVVGVGGDPVHGLGFTEILQLFFTDPETAAILLIGEIGGGEEQRAAKYIKSAKGKTVFAFVAGASAPEGVQMGHAGAIMNKGQAEHADKVRVLAKAGVRMIPRLDMIGLRIAEEMAKI